jgi:hypothetical protein
MNEFRRKTVVGLLKTKRIEGASDSKRAATVEDGSSILLPVECATAKIESIQIDCESFDASTTF